MADVTARPNGTVTSGSWTGNHTDVDDVVTYPSTPDGLRMTINTDNPITPAVLSLPAPGIPSRRVTVFMYGNGDDTSDDDKDPSGFSGQLTIGSNVYGTSGSSSSTPQYVQTSIIASDVWLASDFVTAFRIQLNAFNGEKDNDSAAVDLVYVQVFEAVPVFPSVLTVSLEVKAPSVTAGATVRPSVLTVSIGVVVPVLSAGASFTVGMVAISLSVLAVRVRIGKLGAYTQIHEKKKRPNLSHQNEWEKWQRERP